FEFQQPAFTFAKQCDGLEGSFTFTLDFQFQPAGVDDGVDFDTELTVPCGGQAELDAQTVAELIEWLLGLETPPTGGVLVIQEQDLPEGVSSEFSGECGPAPTGGGGVIPVI